jgi:hypothetical protein
LSENTVISEINEQIFKQNFNKQTDFDTEYIHGETTAQDIILSGFYIKAQYADKYYVEEYEQDIESFTQFLKAENNEQQSISAIITEDKLD